MSARLRFENPETVSPPFGPYSHTVVVPGASELVFLSGQIGVGPDGRCGATIAEQADQAFANVVRLLESHELEVGDVIKLTVFIVAGKDGDAVRQARIRHFGSAEPASSTIYVSQLVRPDWLVEVEAIAARC